jgi:hypothetical protein
MSSVAESAIDEMIVNFMRSKSKCVMCDDELSIEEVVNSQWIPEKWCGECIHAEKERSQEWDTYPNSVVTWRPPRYLLKRDEWYHPCQEKMMYDTDPCF